MLSDCIIPIIHTLNEPTREQLIKALLQLSEKKDQLLVEIPLPKEHAYGRKVLFATNNLEVILVHLPPFTTTRIHDHGESIGAAIVLDGKLTNTFYALDASGAILPYGQQVVEQNQLFTAEVNQIHQMINSSDERMVSLHVYSPPLRGTKVYG